MKLLYTLLLTSLAFSFNAQDFTSVSDGDWDEPSTWDNGVTTPVDGDEVLIENGHTISVTDDHECADLTIDDGTLEIIGSVSLTAEELTLAEGDIEVSDGGTLTTDDLTIEDGGIVVSGDGSELETADMLIESGSLEISDEASVTTEDLDLEDGSIEVTGDASLTTDDLTLEAKNGDVELTIEESTLTVDKGCEFVSNTDGDCTVSFTDATVSVDDRLELATNDDATTEVVSEGTTLTIGDDLFVQSDDEGETLFELSGGSVTVDDEFRLRTAGGGSSSATFRLIDGSITADRMTFIEVGGNTAEFQQREGTATITEGIAITNSDPEFTIINLNSGASAGTFNVGGNFTGDELTIDGGSTSSNFVFNGTAAQTVPTSYSEVSFNDLTLSNTLTTTIDAALTSSNIKGNLSITHGTFNQGGFTIDIASGTYTNAATHSADANVSVSGNFTNTGTYTSTGSDISVGGDWSSTGTYTYATNDIVLFNGSAAQDINSSTEFWELELDNSTGLTVQTGPVDVVGVLDIDAGAFDANGENVTLISNASGTAQMDDIGSGSYTGNLIVQRFMSTTEQGFREITSPVAGTTLSDWQNDGLIFSGFPGSDFPAFSFINDYTYSEANADGDKNDGWVPATAMTNTITHANGHRIYTDITAYTLSVSGNPTQGGVVIALNNDGQGAFDDSGWNLIGNPYAASIDWDSFSAADKNGLDDAYWIWATDGLVAPQYGTYVGSAGSGTFGADGKIAHTQAFWVHGDGTHIGANPSLTIAEADKDITEDSFVKSIDYNDLAKIKAVTDAGLTYDEALFKVKTGSDNSYMMGEDQTKLYTDPQYWPITISLSLIDGAHDMVYSEVGDADHTMYLKAIVGANVSGNINLQFENLMSFVGNSCVTLEDLHNGNTQDLRTNDTYVFQNDAGAPEVRFAIHMTKDFDATATAPLCFEGTDGAIDMMDLTGSNDLYWYDPSGNLIGSQMGVSTPTYTILGLTSGDHNVTVVGGGCLSDSNTVKIPVSAQDQIAADFELDETTIFLNQGGNVIITNNSINATDYVWDMGDGTTYTTANPSHNYATIGTFTITLTVSNLAQPGCTYTVTQDVLVETTTDIANETSDGMNIFSNGSEFVVESLDVNFNGNVTLKGMSGQILFTKDVNLVEGNNLRINTESYAAGVYVITLKGDNGITNYKLSK